MPAQPDRTATIGDGEDLYSKAARIAYQRNQPPLTRELMDRFGGNGFLFNLRMWEARVRSGSACYYVPSDDYYRDRFEVLAKTGVALRGSAVPLLWKFKALPIATLRKAARELGAKTFRSKEEGAGLVANCQGAENWLGANFDRESFFLLQREAWSYDEVEAQWRRYEREIETAGSASKRGSDEETSDRRAVNFWSYALLVAVVLSVCAGIWLFRAIERLLE